MLALEFPPLGHMVDWPNFALKNSELFGINKVVLIYAFAVLFTLLLFTLAHVTMIILAGFRVRMRAMTTGVTETPR